MKRFIHYSGVLYVVFALVAAHTALAPNQTPLALGPGQAAVVAVADGTLLHNQRMDVNNAASDDYWNPDDANDADTDRKGEYTIVCWTGDYCGGCKAWKRSEAPALLKMGYKVVYKDYHTDGPPKDIKMIPTIIIVLKGTAIGSKVAWKAKDIDKFITNHLSLKGNK